MTSATSLSAAAQRSRTMTRQEDDDADVIQRPLSPRAKAMALLRRTTRSSSSPRERTNDESVVDSAALGKRSKSPRLALFGSRNDSKSANGLQSPPKSPHRPAHVVKTSSSMDDEAKQLKTSKSAELISSTSVESISTIDNQHSVSKRYVYLTNFFFFFFFSFFF